MEYIKEENIGLIPKVYDVGLDEENTKVMLINLELYRGSLDNCNLAIRLYNEIPK